MKFIYLTSIVSYLLISCTTTYHLDAVKPKDDIEINGSIPSDKISEKIIEPYKKILDTQMDRVLTYTPYSLDKKGKNPTLCTVIADAMLEFANEKLSKENKHVDIALSNYGGLRRTFSPGNLTVRSMFELVPFENQAVIVKLSPKDFLKMIDFLKNSNQRHPIAGLSISLDKNDNSILVNNKPFDPNKNYTIITSDYLQQGGDKMDFLTNPIEKYPLGIKLRDLFIQYFEKSDTIKINQTPRYR